MPKKGAKHKHFMVFDAKIPNPLGIASCSTRLVLHLLTKGRECATIIEVTLLIKNSRQFLVNR